MATTHKQNGRTGQLESKLVEDQVPVPLRCPTVHQGLIEYFGALDERRTDWCVPVLVINAPSMRTRVNLQ